MKFNCASPNSSKHINYNQDSTWEIDGGSWPESHSLTKNKISLILYDSSPTNQWDACIEEPSGTGFQMKIHESCYF